MAKAVPNREKGRKTFRPLREKVATEAVTEVQYKRFMTALKNIDQGAWLIAYLLLHGCKRRNEVLSLVTGQINWQTRQIHFKQSKAELEKMVTITYPESVMAELQEFLGERTGKVFAGYHEMKLHRRFKEASKRSGVYVTRHMLRATSITVMAQKGYSTDAIIKLSGHASRQMVSRYDKTEQADNISKELRFL